MCMCGWMDCILAEKIATPTLTQPKPFSSPVQVTQPSSTQDSFAMSNGPALRFSLFVPFFATLSRAGPPLSSLPPRSKDGRWWLGCQRPRRWMGNSHWVIWVGGMSHSECNTFWNLWTPWNNVADTMVLLPLLSLLHCCSWCCFLCVTVGHTPLEGEEMSYFTNIVVHNI